MHDCCTVWRLRQTASAVVLLGWLAGAGAHAVDYSWNVGDSGGDWSTTSNWNPGGNPTTADSAALGNVTSGTRTVVYDTGATGTLTGLTLTQTTAGAINLLDVQRSLSVTNAITLGATGGVAQISLVPVQSSSSISTPFTTAGLTINSGGTLSLGVYNTTGTTTRTGDVSGPVTLSGGSIVLAPFAKDAAGTTTSSQNQITGNFTMTGGTVFVNNSGTGALAGRRLQLAGTTTSVTGGSFSSNAATNLMLQSGTITFNPTSMGASISPQLNRSSAQTMTTSVLFGSPLALRGTGVKTYASTAANNEVGAIQISDENNTVGAATTLRLGSNLTLASGQVLPIAGGFAPGGATEVQLGIDTNGFTFNMASNSGVWTPGRPGSLNAVWTLSGSGGLIANGFNFTATATTTNLGAGLTLESRAGNGVANNLGSGTIAATSTFLYSGSAVAATPSTLTAAATVGNVAVSSGALRLGSLGGIAGAATVSGGSLDLGGTTRTFTNVTLTGGEITAGTLATSGAYSLQAGTISAIVSGSQGIAKSTAGTVTLSGANTFSGVAAITAGTLVLGNAAGLGGDTGDGTQKLSMGGGTLDLAGFSPTVYGVTGSTGTITSASGGTLTIKVNNGATGTALSGSMGLATAAASGRSYQVLSAANSYTGTTSIAASTLLAIQSETGLGASGAGQGTTVAGTLELKGPAATAFSVAEPLSISGGTIRTNAQTGTAGTTTLSGPIDLASGTASFEVNTNAPLLRLTGAVGGSGSIAKTAAGTLEITSTSNYSGSTTISAGSLVVNGALTGTSGVAVGTGTRLAGSGTIAAALSGAGLVSPGNSPGILTATQVDPTGGLDQAFEFTAPGSPTYGDAAASVNDVLRLTDPTTPFASSLSAGNVIDVYFDVGSLAAGDTFRGGFYTDLAGDFSGSIAGGTFAYWVKGNGSGTARTFNGQSYYSLTGFDPSLSVTLATVAEAANFGGGTVNGQVTQFAVVPEPGTLALGGIAAGAFILAAARRNRARTHCRS
jgi:autotransporter-associated beta strand protein